MTPLRHLVEPERLLLTWQPTDENARTRTRRVVGEVVPSSDRNGAVFRYLIDSEDFKEAKSAGFKGFPAFKVEDIEFTMGVMDAFVRRLPPRKREDFSAYLLQHGLPSDFNLSDLALLGYTGAKLPSDGFALVPIFGVDAVPCDYVMEVAGTRHESILDLASINSGDAVTIEVERNNPVDSDALALFHDGTKIGYVNRALRPTFHRWMEGRQLSMVVARKNGKPHRPLVYVRVSVA